MKILIALSLIFHLVSYYLIYDLSVNDGKQIKLMGQIVDHQVEQNEMLIMHDDLIHKALLNY